MLFLEVRYFSYWIEFIVWFTSIDQSSEIPLHAEWCEDMIDDEVVPLSYSYTVAIFVKDYYILFKYLSLNATTSSLVDSCSLNFFQLLQTLPTRKHVWFKGWTFYIKMVLVWIQIRLTAITALARVFINPLFSSNRRTIQKMKLRIFSLKLMKKLFFPVK